MQGGATTTLPTSGSTISLPLQPRTRMPRYPGDWHQAVGPGARECVFGTHCKVQQGCEITLEQYMAPREPIPFPHKPEVLSLTIIIHQPGLFRGINSPSLFWNRLCSLSFLFFFGYQFDAPRRHRPAPAPDATPTRHGPTAYSRQPGWQVSVSVDPRPRHARSNAKKCCK
jgi:hypothetical protein